VRYTGPVETGTKHNLTLSIDEGVLLEARKLALERRTTVNQLVRDYLGELVRQRDRRLAAAERLRSAFGKGIVEVGARTWTRDSLHER